MTITAGALIDKACAATGLTDFGGESFREGLERLLHSAQTEARLNDAGLAMLAGQCTMLLMRRLEVADTLARNPAIDEAELGPPLIALGLPRTGSTALHCLLGEDKSWRVIRNWEGMWPCPPPEAGSEASDPRIAAMQAMMDQRNIRTPRMKQMVPSSATSPVEDQMLMGHDFKSHLFAASFRVPSYVEWLNNEADLAPTFDWVKRVLKLLQSRMPARQWVLKNPNYLVFIDALDRAFPGASYCMTHRDVARVVPSAADLYAEMHTPNTDQVDSAWCGAVNVEWCELGLRRLLAFRDAGNEQRFFDAHFSAVQRDPWPVLAGLYAFMGRELTAETRAAMQQWREDQPREKHGAHQYRAADFALDESELRARFAFYTDRFNAGLQDTK